MSSVRRAPCEPRSPRRGAVVLSATLALGGCQLGSRGDVDYAESSAPSKDVASVAPTEGEPLDPDVESTSPRTAEIDASPGFTPDPHLEVGTTAGGPVAANRFDERCRGWIGARPDVLVRAARPFAELAVMVASEADTTLLVLGPGGERRCGDDEDGAHPVVRGSFAPGTYRVWVGTKERGLTSPFVLALSELDDSTPSSLPH